MKIENIEKASKLKKELDELEEFHHNTSELSITVKLHNGGEGYYDKHIPDSIYSECKAFIRKKISEKAKEIMSEIEKL